MFRNTILLILLTLSISVPSRATDLRDIRIFEDQIFDPNIHTILFTKMNWQEGLPIITQGGQDKLLLKFDDLGNKKRNYYYAIRHCDASWHESSLLPMDYMKGFDSNPINDYAPSSNTSVHYGNYQLELPNRDLQLKIPGNYALIVYADNDPSQVVFTRRFYIVEPDVTVDGLIKPSGANSSDQEFDFRVNHPSYNISDPLTEIRVVVMQNRRTDNAVIMTHPQSIKENSLIYEFNNENVFPGGNEFRFFDCKSLRFNSEGIAGISFVRPTWHVQLLPAELRVGKPYSYYREMNGCFRIAAEDRDDPDTEADYVLVDFSFPFPAPLSGGNIHIFGGFSDMHCSSANGMTYNLEKKQYEAELLLKQGYYNYLYTYCPEGETKYNTTNLEGNFFETENEYLVLVYHKPVSSRYEKLIGYQLFNTNDIKGIQLGW